MSLPADNQRTKQIRRIGSRGEKRLGTKASQYRKQSPENSPGKSEITNQLALFKKSLDAPLPDNPVKKIYQRISPRSSGSSTSQCDALHIPYQEAPSWPPMSRIKLDVSDPVWSKVAQSPSKGRSVSAGHVEGMRRRAAFTHTKINRVKSSNALVQRSVKAPEPLKEWSQPDMMKTGDMHKSKTFSLPKIVVESDNSKPEDVETRVQYWLSTIDVDISRRYAHRLMIGMSISDDEGEEEDDDG